MNIQKNLLLDVYIGLYISLLYAETPLIINNTNPRICLVNAPTLQKQQNASEKKKMNCSFSLLLLRSSSRRRRKKKSEAGIKWSLNILKISEILPDFSAVKADQISISFPWFNFFFREFGVKLVGYKMGTPRNPWYDF